MICIVTGGLGFIGSHIVDLLIEQSHKVFVVDNLSTGSIHNLNDQAEYEINDILNLNFLTEYFKKINPDWIFHTAALPRIQPSYEDPILHDDVNVRGTLNVLEACKTINIKALVYSSSSAVYGTPTMIPTDENAAISPLSPYALQKYAAERYLHILGEKYNIPLVSLRYFNPYGPRSFNKKNPFNAYTSVVGIFTNQKSENKTLTITGDGSQERDFIHVKDVARANLLAAEKIQLTDKNVYNVGYGECISILQLAKLFNHPYTFVPERLGEAKITHANIDAMKSLGWMPKYQLNKFITENSL